MKKKNTANAVSDFLEISRDILVNIPRIVITGNGVINIEGFLGIEEYMPERTVIKTKSGLVVISSDNLMIDEICEEYIMLKGDIKSVEFM